MADTTLAYSVYRMYTPPKVPATPAPKGYKPFYISHYGRHGSRYIMRNKYTDDVVRILETASKNNGLTEYGKGVLARLNEAQKSCKGRAGELTQIGVQQHRDIAHRMFENYPEIFRHNPQITAVATYVPRVVRSMASFTNELIRCNPKLEIWMDDGKPYMSFLNPYTYDRDSVLAHRIDQYRYPLGPWSKDREEFKKKYMDNSRIIKSIFKESYIPEVKDMNYFIQELYRTRITLPGTACGVDLADVFTKEELYQWWRIANMKFYFEKGPSGVGGGFLNDVCITLLEELMRDAKCSIQKNRETNQPIASLRFGHDGVIVGVLNTMNVSRWSDKAPSMETIEEYFTDFDIPMAANLVFVFYKNRKGDILVKMLLNEEEIQFPLESDCKPYYHWKDVEAYYDKLIENIHHNPR